MADVEVGRDSAEYAETIAEVFVETVQRCTQEAMCCEYDNEEITPSLMECLQYVCLHGASPVRQIGWGLDVSVSAASQLVDRLVRRGLATRRENETDRRLAKVDLTDAGREVVGQMRKRRSEWFASIVENMPKSKRQALLEGLEGFLRVALAHDGNIDRACARCGIGHAAFCVIDKVRKGRSEAGVSQKEPRS